MIIYIYFDRPTNKFALKHDNTKLLVDSIIAKNINFNLFYLQEEVEKRGAAASIEWIIDGKEEDSYITDYDNYYELLINNHKRSDKI